MRRLSRLFVGVLLACTPTIAFAQASFKPLDAAPNGRSVEPVSVNPNGAFEFGSYGRVGIASDLEGRVAQSNINLDAHGPRWDADSYVELELRRDDKFKNEVESRVVATVALEAPFFHFTGDLSQTIVVRNLYAQAKIHDIVVWMGSRMYRGDDIYLLNWWPLDNQNTIGGGGSYDFKKLDSRLALHVGMERLDDPTYSYQTVPAPSPFGLGSTGVVSLNRPRVVETIKYTQLFRNGRIFKDPNAGMKITAYSEIHEISAGVYTDPTTQYQTPLPSDWGFLAGAQVGFWTGKRDTHLNLYVRYARGLAAYDILSVPSTFANDHTTGDSQEFLTALGANWEKGSFGLLAGAYYRYFSDGSQTSTSTQRYSEGAVDLRPQVYLGKYFGLAVDASYQARRYAYPALDGSAGPLFASLWRFAFIPYFSPFGRGSYVRPQFQILYALSIPDPCGQAEVCSGYRGLFPVGDIRETRAVQQFLGLNVEWWFNSSSYP